MDITDEYNESCLISFYIGLIFRKFQCGNEIYESQMGSQVEADNYGKIVAINSDDRVERCE
jgi:hypothetical protein